MYLKTKFYINRLINSIKYDFISDVTLIYRVTAMTPVTKREHFNKFKSAINFLFIRISIVAFIF